MGWERLSSIRRQVAKLQGQPDIHADATWQADMRHHLAAVSQLSSENIEDQRQRLAGLTDAWFADLHGLQAPFLLVLDTFEQASTEVQHWVAHQLLPGVTNTPQMRVLIAGQTIPEQSIEWDHCCDSELLPGVLDAEAWLPVAEAMQRQIPSKEWLAGVCYALKGNPSKILKAIETRPQVQTTAPPPARVLVDKVKLRQKMDDLFEVKDLIVLCFDMAIEYEELSGDGKLLQIISLIKHVEKRGRMPELLNKCREMRSHVEWQ